MRKPRFLLVFQHLRAADESVVPLSGSSYVVACSNRVTLFIIVDYVERFREKHVHQEVVEIERETQKRGDHGFYHCLFVLYA